jgi:hypothetical protein
MLKRYGNTMKQRNLTQYGGLKKGTGVEYSKMATRGKKQKACFLK